MINLVLYQWILFKQKLAKVVNIVGLKKWEWLMNLKMAFNVYIVDLFSTLNRILILK